MQAVVPPLAGADDVALTEEVLLHFNERLRLTAGLFSQCSLTAFLLLLSRVLGHSAAGALAIDDHNVVIFR